MPVTQTFQVASGADDAYENDNGVAFYGTSNYVLFNSDATSSNRRNGGLRFVATIPQGSTITAATLDVFYATGGGSGWGIHCIISAEDVDDADDFVTTADVTTRLASQTTATVSWEVASEITPDWQTSPDIATVIQEIVSRAGWASGNGLVILLEGKTTPTEDGRCYSYEGSSTLAAKLTVTYAAFAGGHGVPMI